MGCFTYQEKISDYIDNLLPALERQQMQAHLSSCSLCSTIYDDLVMIYAASRHLPEHEPSEAVWQRIITEISPRRAGVLAPAGSGLMARWFPFKSLRPSAMSWHPALAAVLLFIGVAAAMYYRSYPPSSPPPKPPAGTPNWASGPSIIEVQPTNKLIVHKPMIEVEIVQRRIDELQRHIQTVQSRWSPEVQALYQHQLQMVDHCINNCQDKLAIQSGDPAVRAVYQAALRAKLEMLKQFSDM
jgi:hypothetical protein